MVSTCIALTLGELVIRATDIAPKMRPIEVSAEDSIYELSDNPILGYQLKADYRNQRPEGLSLSFTNSWGLRDIERSLEKPEGGRRIILLGDSVVENLEVKEFDKTITGQLDAMLTDAKTEVLNFGIGGYCTRAEVELLRTKGLQFNPDLVILLFIENDWANHNTELAIGMSSSVAAGWVRSLLAHSQLFRLCAWRMKWFGANAEEIFNGHTRAIGDNNVALGLMELSRLANDHDFEVLVALWPEFEETGISHRQYLTDDFLLIEYLAGLYGLPTVRLAPYFEEHYRSINVESSPAVYYTAGDGMHTCEEGASATAEILKELIEAPELRDIKQFNPADFDAGTKLTLLELARNMDIWEANLGWSLIHAGIVHLEFGREEDAQQFFQAAAETYPDQSRYYFEFGKKLLGSSMSAKAPTCFERGMFETGEAAEDCQRAWFDVKSSTDSPEQMRGVLEQLIEEKGKSRLTLEQLGTIDASGAG